VVDYLLSIYEVLGSIPIPSTTKEKRREPLTAYWKKRFKKKNS
jgi:hypothetical protein